LVLLLLLVLEGFLPKAVEQLGYLVVFDGDHFLEAVELDAEELILVVYALLQVLQLEVEDLLELVSEFIKLFAFLLVGLVAGNALLLDEFLQASDLLVLLVAHLFDPALDDSFYVFLLGQRLLELPDLELVPFLLLQEFLSQALHLPLLIEVRLLPTLQHEGNPLFFGILSLNLPLLSLPL
jgi:hypothetical protein